MPIGDNTSKICVKRRLRRSAGKVRCKTRGREDIGGGREGRGRHTIHTNSTPWLTIVRDECRSSPKLSRMIAGVVERVLKRIINRTLSNGFLVWYETCTRAAECNYTNTLDMRMRTVSSPRFLKCSVFLHLQKHTGMKPWSTSKRSECCKRKRQLRQPKGPWRPSLIAQKSRCYILYIHYFNLVGNWKSGNRKK